jgi:hypothetical protein
VTVNARQHALFVSPRLSTTPFLMDLVTKPLIMRALFGEKRRLLRGEIRLNMSRSEHHGLVQREHHPRRPKLQIRRRVVVADHSAISLRFWRPWAWRGRAASHPRTSLRSSRSPFPGKSDFRVQRQNGHNVRRGRVRESRDQVDRAGRRQYVGIWGRSGKSPPCGD